MTWNRVWAWMWMSPDGPLLFSSRFKAADYIEQLHPGGRWECVQRDHVVWAYITDGLEIHISREQVR